MRGQKLKYTLFHPDHDFLVKQSNGLLRVIGILSLLVFLISAGVDRYVWPKVLVSFSIFGFCGLLFIAMSLNEVVLIRINKTGLFYYDSLVTGWEHFLDARIAHEAISRTQTVLHLYIRYYSADYGLLHTKTIALTDAKDKTEEEITAAIKFYCNESGLNAVV